MEEDEEDIDDEPDVAEDDLEHKVTNEIDSYKMEVKHKKMILKIK